MKRIVLFVLISLSFMFGVADSQPPLPYGFGVVGGQPPNNPIPANTGVPGITFLNSVAASLGNQEWSPCIQLSGQGWGTTAPASYAVDWQICNVPVQGTATPTPKLSFFSQTNGGGFVDLMDLILGASNSLTLSGPATGLGINYSGVNRINLGSPSTLVGPWNINASSNFVTNIGTGSTTSAVNVGGGSNEILLTPQSSATVGLVIANLTTGTNADFLCLATGGPVLVQTSACTISSKRFKEHLLDFRASALPAIGGMEVVSFNMKPREKPNADPNFGTRQIGLTAENIAEVAPECAIYENDMKTPKSYRQECVIALLVKSVQEQQYEILRLQRRRK